MIRFRYLPFTWGKPKFQVSCAQYPLPFSHSANKQVQCLVFHILFYGRVRRLLEKARRPFCNRVPDQLTSKGRSS